MWITIKPYLHIPVIKTTTITTATPPLIKFSTTLHRKVITNSNKTQNSGEEIGGLGHAVLSAIKSNIIEATSTTTTTTSSATNPNQKREEKLGIEREERTISGSDVLWALQKATTVKKKKKIVKKKKMAENGDGDYNSSGGSDEDEDYYSNVKPFNIKNEWIHKLDDLDFRLKQLCDENLIV